MSSDTISPHAILEQWFGSHEPDGQVPAELRQRWWLKDADYDETLKARFEPLHRAALLGRHDDWLETPTSALALILALDQIPRNIFRDTPRAFASDLLARTFARQTIAAGFDTRLGCHQRSFVYMPLMHSEEIADHDHCCALFAAMKQDEASGPHAEDAARTLDYAHQHRDLIVRFGRYPHRNAILHRKNTDAEMAYLAEPGAGF